MTEMASVSMERGVLGALLLNNATYQELKLHAHLFALPFHQEVYRAISAIIGAGGSADIVTVSQRTGKPGDVAAMTTEGTSVNAAYYVGELRELYRKRKLEAMARGVAARLGEASSADIMAYVDAEMLAAAEESSGGYRPMADFIPDFLARLDKACLSGGALTGVPTGLLDLDRLTNGFQRSDVIIIAARPSVGKTALALHMAVEMMTDKVRVGIFSAEMSGEQLLRRMTAKLTRIEATRIQSGKVQGELHRINEALADLQSSKIFINERSNIRIDELISDAKRMKRKEHIDVLFVDYLGLLTHDGARAIPRHEQVAEISRRLKGLARELDIPVVVLSQLTRDSEGKQPTLSNLRDSGAVEQDADVVILLHPTDTNATMQGLNLILAKHRNGPTGEIAVTFNRRTMSFHARDFRHE